MQNYEKDFTSLCWDAFNSDEAKPVGITGTIFIPDTIPENGSGSSNGAGLYDMSGNLAEWAWEAPNNDPKQTRHIVCGGCWAMYADDMKVHMMHYYPTKSRERFIGFRFICKTKENQIKSA